MALLFNRQTALSCAIILCVGIYSRPGLAYSAAIDSGNCTISTPGGWTHNGATAVSPDGATSLTIAETPSSQLAVQFEEKMGGTIEVEDSNTIVVSKALPTNGGYRYYAVTKTSPSCSITVTASTAAGKAIARQISATIRRK